MLARAAAGALALGVLVVWQTAAAPFAAILPQEPEPDPSILFVGDIMLDRSVARHAAASSTEVLFRGVLPLFKTADANVANLEGAITQNPSIAQVDNTILHFTFDPVLAEQVLRPLNLTAVSLANNHAYDFGRAGYDATRKYLGAWNIAGFGHPYNANNLGVQFVIGDKGYCVLGYHSLYDASTTALLEDIPKSVMNCHRVIVFAHWGDEYTPVANAQQVAAAHAFIDAGAHLVIGAHPHVVQNIEVYKGRAIFYSLGNFMFDQDFSWATTHGLAVRVSFGEETTGFKMTPITIKGQEATIANEPDAARVLEATGRLAEWSLPW